MLQTYSSIGKGKHNPLHGYIWRQYYTVDVSIGWFIFALLPINEHSHLEYLVYRNYVTDMAQVDSLIFLVHSHFIVNYVWEASCKLCATNHVY